MCVCDERTNKLVKLVIKPWKIREIKSDEILHSKFNHVSVYIII